MQENLLKLPPDCLMATISRRIKRFSVELTREGKVIMAHTNNTGAMLGLPLRGAMALISAASSAKRKLPYTLERIWHNGADGCSPGKPGFWIGVNTRIPNLMLEAAFLAGKLSFAEGYASIQKERVWGESRLDACLEGPDKKQLWIECKNVTLVRDNVAFFPDAASARAQKHLRSLMGIRRQGARAAMFFAVQRPDAMALGPADFIDPLYGRLFRQALDLGVEAYAWQITQNPDGFGLGPPLPLTGV